MQIFEFWDRGVDPSCGEANSSSLPEDIYPETIFSLYFVGKIQSSMFLEYEFLVFGEYLVGEYLESFFGHYFASSVLEFTLNP